MGVNSVARAPLRSAVALVLLVGFYATTVGLVLVLVAAPVVAVRSYWSNHAGMFNGCVVVVVCAAAWGTAATLVRALVARGPQEEPDPIPLRRDDAPAVFALIEELAGHVETRPPDETRVVAGLAAGVHEEGSFFGYRRRRRLLVLGLPLVTMFEVGELRAALTYILYRADRSFAYGYTHALFFALCSSNLGASSASALLRAATSFPRTAARLLGRTYVRIYIAIMSTSERRQALAGDVASVQLAGRAATVRALEKAHIVGPLFRGYVHAVRRLASRYQAVPTDLLAGYDRLLPVLERDGAHATLLAEFRAAKPNPMDTHPRLAARLAIVATCAEGAATVDEDRRPAMSLFPDAATLDRWMEDAFPEMPLKTMTRVPWALFHEQVVAPALQRRAAEWVEKLRVDPTAAGTFAFVVSELDRGNGPSLVRHAFAETRRFYPRRFERIAPSKIAELVGDLFAAALLERGGRVQPLLPERTRIVIELASERVIPFAVAGKDDGGSTPDMAVLRQWAERWTAPALRGEP